jgi:uncharacterized protein (TIGR03435 family)
MNRIAVTTLLAVVAVSSLPAQQPRPGFEVASVRAQTAAWFVNPARAIPRVRPGGVFSGTHVTVAGLIMFAYDVTDFQISGGPSWIRQHYFDINAKSESPDAGVDEIRLMVQSLLEERFRLIVHVEQREMRSQVLVRARPDRPFGPNLLPIDDCSPARVNELRRKFPEKYPTPTGAGIVSACSSRGVMTLADMLTMGLEMPVIDATGLKGSFYYVLYSQFSPIPSLLGSNSNDPSLPALPTALEEQLGLRLEFRRSPFDVLVISSVEQPTEN